MENELILKHTISTAEFQHGNKITDKADNEIL